MIREIKIDIGAPIILLAVARSGSSLLRSLLTTHPEIRLLESTLIAKVIQNFPTLAEKSSSPGIELIQEAQNYIVDAFHNAPLEDPDMGILHKKCVTRWGFTVHQIENALVLERLQMGFPRAHWIHLVRDGRAVSASWMEHWELATGETSTPNLTSALNTWIQSVHNVQNGPKHHRIRLEDLTSAKKRTKTFSELMSYIDLPISPRQNAFLKAWPAINTSRTGKNLSKRSFSDEQRSVFQETPALENALEIFGYDIFVDPEHP